MEPIDINIYVSVTSSLQLSLAEFRDEKAWPQFQFGVYKKIVGLWFFFGFEGQKLGTLLENKVNLKSTLWKYANDKSWAPFFSILQ